MDRASSVRRVGGRGAGNEQEAADSEAAGLATRKEVATPERVLPTMFVTSRVAALGDPAGQHGPARDEHPEKLSW